MAPLNTSSVFLSSSLLMLFLLCSSEKGYALQGRKITERHLPQHSHVTIEIGSLLPASVCSPSPKGNIKRASLKVVHRHGPCSQLGQDKANAPSVTQILSQDQSRVDSIQSRLAFNSGKNSSLKNSQATLPANSGRLLGTGNYFVTVGLGTPEKKLSLEFDTGSDLTWTQCQPCVVSCYKQQEPTFDPSQSTTYSNVTCDSLQCSQLTSATGNSPGCSGNTCLYRIRYSDQSFSIGYFAKEKLTLTSTDVIDGFLFGCGQNNQGLFRGTAGLLGLGRDKLSVVSQASQKYGNYFSYCLPSISSSSTGHLTFGNSGVPSNVQFTQLLTNPQGPSFYFIDIEAISVGGSTLPIDESVYSTAGGTIIDSGTVITRLPPDAYSAMRTVFQQQMTKYPMTQGVSIFDTCYDFSNYTGNISIPTISFFFIGSVKVDLDPSGILYGVGTSQACLAFAGNSNATDVGIFGNVQQQTFEVIYDVAGGKLGFGPGQCS
uniref:Peptidase A1 domain-containing protein n=1 Tax=Davidia involucrata TaxID=16924 RepID=A0A5B6ZNU0_DAVIN